MNPANYGGLKYDLFYGNADGTNFQKVTGVSNIEPDNSSDEVTRNFIDGDNLKLTTNFQAAFNITLTDIGQANLEKIVPGYVYASGEDIDGVTGVKAGAGKAVSVGVEKGNSAQVNGVLKLVPKLAAQSPHTLYLLEAKAELVDVTLDDMLEEFIVKVSGKLVKGDLTFTPES